MNVSYCLAPEEGKGIRVYDLHVTDNPRNIADNSIRTRFDVKGISYRRLVKLGFAELRQSGKNKIRRALKGNMSKNERKEAL